MKLDEYEDMNVFLTSPPAWGRGLKHGLEGQWPPAFPSPPAWGRGLKLRG